MAKFDWITERLWNSENPQLTKCFANIGVSILPNVLLILIGLFEFITIHRSTNKPIRFNKFNVTRFLICLCLIGTNLITFITYGYSIVFNSFNTFTFSDLFSSLSKLLVSVFLAIISHCQRRKGVITSGIIFIVNFLLTIFSVIHVIDVLSYNRFMYSDFERQDIYRNFLCIASLLGLSCFADDAVDAGLKPPAKKVNAKESSTETLKIECEDEQNQTPPISPRKYCSFLSKMTFYWYTKFVTTAAKREIELNEIWQVEDELTVEASSKEFDAKYFKELDRIKQSNSRHSTKERKFNTWSFIRVVFKTYGKEWLALCLVKLFFDVFNFMAPKLLSQLIQFVNNDGPTWKGFLIVFGFILTSFIKNVLINLYFQSTVGIGMRLKTALTNLIFSKALKLGPKGKKTRTTAEIVNLIQIDCGRFSDLAPYLAFIWSAPLQICIGIYMLLEQFGSVVFVGVAIIFAILILNSVLIHFVKKFYLKEMKIKDERIKLINELLSAVKIVKLYGWEQAFIDKIKNERDKEVKCNKRILYIEVMNYFLFAMTSTLVLVSTIGVYIFAGFGNNFTVEKIFVSIALFNILQFPIEFLPVLFTYLTMCRVSINRINSFLTEDELEGYVSRDHDDKMALFIRNKAKFVYELDNDETSKDEKQNGKTKKVKFSTNTDDIKLEDSENQQDKKQFALKNIELEVEKGKFICIIGQVGSGKSSLISAILGEMYMVENELGERGQVNINKEHSICYVAQAAWIQNESLKQNILFGKVFDEEKYEQVIRACALEPDLKQFEAGDETEIGEKGINLSGGQKQRVGLARACYSSVIIGDNQQIILLDDVLSAVDAHVGKHICENLLNSKTGILKDTTRILVTNQLNQLGDLDADQIVLMKDGEIQLKCTYEELLQKQENGELDSYNLILSQNKASEEENDDDKKSEESDISSQTSSNKEKKKNKSQTGKNLILKERHEVGRVDSRNYYNYLKYFGKKLAIICLIFLILDSFFSVYLREYLSKWSNNEFEANETHEKIQNFHIEHFQNYLIYSSLQCIFNLIANVLLVVGIVNTIKLFHKILLFKILRSPMTFFDRTPIGRITNRFSKDIDGVDKGLPRSLREFVLAFTNLVGSLVIILYKQPSSFIFYFLIFVVYYFVLDLYVNTSRQLKRYESTTRSPIYSHFQETINGTTTIRAFNKVEEFENESKNKISINNRASWFSFQGNRSLGFHLELLASVILFIVSIQFVINKKETSAGDVGLVTSYALNINEFLAYVIRCYSYLEINAISIERIQEYCENKEEDEWIKNYRPKRDWPQNGVIEFVDYSTRYREDSNLVLKNLNFKVNGAEKVGIVGRTGAGKSSMTLSLFRIIEPTNGRILIDNVDISKIGLYDLRSKLSIIPQDAVLFSGTIRFNLDPFDSYSDEEIYRSLEHAHLKDYVNTLEDGIYHKIAEGGENLSVGQRQLVCLARALLKKSKILVLDEASASLDIFTDELVQKTIRSEFQDCTTITIAHRLKTVIDSSRILVLDKGELLEYDTPGSLLDNQNSLFYFLASKANLV